MTADYGRARLRLIALVGVVGLLVVMLLGMVLILSIYDQNTRLLILECAKVHSISECHEALDPAPHK